MTTESTKTPRRAVPLVIAASILSIASLAWTATSIYDLLLPEGAGGVHWAGLAVAIGSDIVWGSVLIAEWKQIKLGWTRTTKEDQTKEVNLTHAVGWMFLAAVVTLLVWHGMLIDNPAAAFGGSLIPIGAKVVWLLAIAANRDPAALTPEQQAHLIAQRRDSQFTALKAAADRERLRLKEEAERAEARAKHEAALEQVRMQGELQRAKDEVSFTVELERMEKIQELRNRRPILGEVLGYGQEQPQVLGASQAASVEEETPFPVAHAVPSAASAPSRVTVTLPAQPDELTPARKRNQEIAAEFWAIKRMSGGVEAHRGNFAASKGVSAGQLSKILNNQFKEDSFEDAELEEAAKRLAS